MSQPYKSFTIPEYDDAADVEVAFREFSDSVDTALGAAIPTVTFAAAPPPADQPGSQGDVWYVVTP